MKTDFIIIWGMRRSGATALAASLELFGARLGDDFERPGEEGYSGEFEDARLARLNRAMLRRLGMNRDSLCDIGPAETKILVDAGFLDKAAAYLRARGAEGSLIGLKDPRMTKLGLFWREVFSRLELAPYSIVCARDPMSLADALRREALSKKYPAFYSDTDYGQLLWLSYTLGALIYTEGYPRVLVDYDKFMAAPETTLEDAAHKFGMPLASENFPGLREAYFPSHKDARFKDAPLIPRVERLYRLLSEARGLECPSAEAVGPMWPHGEMEKIMARLLGQASREARENQAYIASLTSQISRPSR